jgi:hypothetical protein
MATRILDSVPVERITAEARAVNLGRALLTLLLGVFWALGWLIGMASLGIGFVWAAAKTGFLDARAQAGRPPRAGPA